MKKAVVTLVLMAAAAGLTSAATVESYTAAADPNANPDGISSLTGTADVWQVTFTADGCSGSYFATNSPGGNPHEWALYSCPAGGTNGGAEAFHTFDGGALATGQVASINYAYDDQVARNQTVGIRLYSGVGKEVEFSFRGGGSQFRYTDAGTTNGNTGLSYDPGDLLKVSFIVTGSNTYVGTVTEPSTSELISYWTGTFANPITQIAVFNNRAGNNSDQYFDNLAIAPNSICTSTTCCVNILFMGNSFTFGNTDPVEDYNNAHVHDFNGTHMGGVPGIFQKLAADGGRSNLIVNIEAAPGQTLAWHLANKSGVVTNPGSYGPWDWVVLQDFSTRPTAVAAAGGDVAGFRSNVQSLNNLAMNNNPAVRTLLYCTWGRPDEVTAGYYSSIQSMQGQLTTNYSNAASDFNLFGFAPVGDAFMAAVASGLSINPNVTPTPGPGQINLWQDDNRHADTEGSFLAALVFYAKILGADPRSLPTGPGSAASDLGLNSTVVTQLQNIAYEMVLAGTNFSFVVAPNAQAMIGGSNATYTVTVGAMNGFNGDVALSVTGLPTDVCADFNPASVTGSGTSALSLTTSTNTPPGSYPLTVTGTSSITTHTAMVTLTINVPDFSFAVDPEDQTVTVGSNATYTVTVGAINGFNGDVALSVTGLPTDVCADFNPASVTGSGTSALSLTTSTNTPAGSYPLTVTGTSSITTHTAMVTLTINSPYVVIPDWWKQQYFDCTNCPQAGPMADPDGDGMDNLAEFLAGTDPTNSASALCIIGLSQEDEDMRVTWTTAGGRTNAVQAAAGGAQGSYASTNFIDISGLLIIAGSGDTTTNYVDVGGATNGSVRFYRVRLAP